ncbi:MAG: SsrA-binding protein SmpB [Gammaproteobacteria bacterium]
MSAKNQKIITINKNAKRNYSFSKTFQAGISLLGWEVKSLRESKIDIKDSYITVRKNEAFIIGVKIDPPASLKNESTDPLRSRKLLLNKKEIIEIQKNIQQKNLTCISTQFLWVNNKVKVDIAIGKGKKLRDQREDIKKRDWQRNQDRIFKNSNK